MKNTIKIKKHVAVFAFPFATHAGLLLGLLRWLAKSLPDVTFSFFTTTKSMASLFSDKAPPTDQLNIKPFDIPDGIPEGYVFSGRPQEDINLFLNVASDNFRKGLEVAEEVVGEKVSCIIADAFLWFSSEIAAEIGCCWVPVWTSGAGSLSMHVYTQLIRQTLGVEGLDGREDEILEFIPGFSEVRLGDLPGGVVSGNLESPFSVMLYKMGQILHRADALPINSFEELDPPLINNLKSMFKNVLNVGPFNLTSPTPFSNISDIHGCIPWLDKQRSGSVVYIGFGTVATPPPTELKALAEALMSTKTPFLWSLKDNMKSHLPEELLDGSNTLGKIVPWAPQVKVLEHNSVGVFINHCGWNSVLESIAAGVPIICRPFFGDHQLNSWMVEKVWQIGMRIEGGVFTKDVTIRALEVMFCNGKGKKYKEQVVGYKKLAFEAVGPNGSSTKGFQDLVDVITKCM